MIDQVPWFDVPPADDGADLITQAELEGHQGFTPVSNTRTRTINSLRGEVTFTEHAGPDKHVMLQITQGFANAPGAGPDEPGFIDLTARDAYLVALELLCFVKERAAIRASALRQQIVETSELQKTVFSDAADCERFIADLKIADVPIMLLDRYGSL
jgi:hypothetical protein